MKADAYHTLKPLFYAACLIIGLLVAVILCRRRPGAELGDRLLLSFSSIVAVTAVAFIAWLYFVSNHVKIRDEGIQVAYEFLLGLGPSTALAAILGWFAGKHADIARILPWVYLPCAGIMLLI